MEAAKNCKSGKAGGTICLVTIHLLPDLPPRACEATVDFRGAVTGYPGAAASDMDPLKGKITSGGIRGGCGRMMPSCCRRSDMRIAVPC